MTGDVIAGRETPELLAALEAEFGAVAAANVASAVGGIEVYIPQHREPIQGPCRLIDPKIVAWISRHYGFGKIIIPLGKARSNAAEAARLFGQGLSNRQVARRLGVHQRTVERLRRQIRLEAKSA